MDEQDQLGDLLQTYCIRQKSTGYFMPMVWGSGQPRYSRTKPQPNVYPRLFRDRKSAQQALNQWLKGEWSLEVDYDYDYGTVSDVYLSVKPVKDRDPSDFEIVKTTLLIHSTNT